MAEELRSVEEGARGELADVAVSNLFPLRNDCHNNVQKLLTNVFIYFFLIGANHVNMYLYFLLLHLLNIVSNYLLQK